MARALLTISVHFLWLAFKPVRPQRRGLVAFFACVLLGGLVMGVGYSAPPVNAPSEQVIQHLPNDPAYVQPKKFDWKRIFRFKKETPPPDPETIVNVGPREIPSLPGTIVRVNQPFCTPQRWHPGVYRATLDIGVLMLQGPHQQVTLPLQVIPRLSTPSDTMTEASPFGHAESATAMVVQWDVDQQWFDVSAGGRRFHTQSLSCD